MAFLRPIFVSRPVFSEVTMRCDFDAEALDGTGCDFPLATTDPDLGAGGQVSFVLLNPAASLFAVDLAAGTLTFVAEPDRGTEQVFIFRIVAQVRHFSAILTVLGWICAGIPMCGALPSPVLA